MEDPQSAVAAIVAASNDTEALAAAIKEACFLEAIPGEDRQKLRGVLGTDRVSPGSTVTRLMPHGCCSCQDEAEKAESR